MLPKSCCAPGTLALVQHGWIVNSYPPARSQVRLANSMKRMTLAFTSGFLLFAAACSHPAAGGAHASSKAASAAVSAAPSATPLASSSARPSPRVSAGSLGGAVTWQGQFTGYGTAAWQRHWGYVDQGSFGQAQVSELSDTSAPGGGSVLRVVYGRGSSANSCGNCPNPGGAQFYTSFASAGHADLIRASVLYLRYYVKFQPGFDFSRGGKLPGLYGGPTGQESGGNHGQAFSTRYMWRDHPVTGSPSDCSTALPCSEVYLYSPVLSSGYGLDIGGSWHWQGDGRWHMVEQRVDRASGDITVWYDGTRVLFAPGALGGALGVPFSGVLFSTFFGGHDTSWGPAKTESAYFADFAVSTSYIEGH
jgi:hypothetical protein